MGSLSSSSTLAQVEAAYDDNASWLEDQDLAKAKKFSEAVRILLRRSFSSATKGGNSVSYRISLLRKELDNVTDWIQIRDTGKRRLIKTRVGYGD